MYPILDVSQNTSSMRLVLTIKNGKAYQVTVPNDGGNTVSSYYVFHVWGNAHDMGFAQGQMLKQLTTGPSFIQRVWAYLKNQVESGLPADLPQWLMDLIAVVGLDAALDATEEVTYLYTNPNIYTMMAALADGSGDDYSTIVKVHMLAGLTQGHCSMLGAWGSALADPTGLLQLRALDWNMDGPFRDFSAITVYHPNDPSYGHAYINIGFAGFVGVITGISETKLAISEIGVAMPDETFGDQSRIGVPFIFILHDILSLDNTVDDAINRMQNSRRTCDLILGVGDGKLNQFRGFEYSYSVLNVFDDKNMMPYNETWHPRIPDVVYWGMDWICPAFNLALGQAIQKYHGQISPEVGIRYISAVEQSGDNHIVYYDLKNMDFYVSFAAPFSVGGNVAAFDRQYTKFDATALFAEPQPNESEY